MADSRFAYVTYIRTTPEKLWQALTDPEFTPELREEGYSRLTYELEKKGGAVKLTAIHEMDRTGSKFIQAVSGGWPLILASLKSLLETGEPLEETRHWPKGM